MSQSISLVPKALTGLQYVPLFLLHPSNLRVDMKSNNSVSGVLSYLCTAAECYRSSLESFSEENQLNIVILAKGNQALLILL